MKTTFQTLLTAGTKQVAYGDPVRNLVTNERARFSKVEPDGMVELMNDEGVKQADLWHPTQIAAY